MPDPLLRAAVRLHLCALTPRQRADLVLAAGGLQGLASSPPSALSAPFHAVREQDVDDEFERCDRKGIAIVMREHPRWPTLLGEITDAPQVLWVRGELPDTERLPFALVGPRKPTPYGLAVARRLASELASRGAVVISGGALGIDAEAHRAALSLGEPTVAVLGCGVDVAYPPAHADLFCEIASRGALVSEFPCGTAPRRHHFPVRNRLLAGWARAVLVVEATFKSGSLITARLALEQGRDVLAVPGPVTSCLSEGTNELLAGGARVLRGIDDVIGELREDEVGRLRSPEAPAPAPGGGGHGGDPLLAVMPEGAALSIDELAVATGLGIGALLARLVGAEAAGHATSLPGGLWMRGGIRR